MFTRIGNEDPFNGTADAADKKLAWSTDKRLLEGTESGFSGAEWGNLRVINTYGDKQQDKIPAFIACKNLGYGFVLPTRDELNAALKWNLMLGPSFRFVPQSEVWTCSQVDQNNAYTVQYGGGTAVTVRERDKTASYIVRCTRPM